MAAVLPVDEDLHSKAIHLFTYLKELSELRTRTIRQLDSYERVVWLDDLPQEPGCYSAAWSSDPGEDSADTWLEVRKPQPMTPPPSVPDALAPWLDLDEVADSSLEMPELLEQIPAAEFSEEDEDEPDQEPRYEYLGDHPEILTQWERYVEDRWLPWAEKDRRRQAVQSIYTDLFSIYQKQQRLGEQYEVVLGLGLLTWLTPHNQVVNRHLVTAQTNLAFDAARGIMTVGPAADGPGLTLEQDMLEAQERPDAVEQQAVAQQLAEIGEQIWDQSALASLFSAWVHAVSPQGRYDETLQPASEASSDPTVALAPALILRKRTERSLIRIFDEIIDQLQHGAEVPAGVHRLLAIVDDREADAEPSPHSNGDVIPATIDDIYFPLAANKEQRDIVQRLRTRQGILVQGPPGTGKSHTIANLVCHLLATGQRVLVTSHAPRALEVLHDKIPPAVANLCVSLLGNDRAALEDLENAVHGITDRYDRWDADENQRLIDGLEQQLDKARRSEARLRGELRALRESETYTHQLGFGGYEGTAAKIAERVGQEAPSYAWLADRPGEDAAEPPLTVIESLTLLTLVREMTPERINAARQAAIPSDRLIAPNEFAQAQRRIAQATIEAQSMAEHRDHPAYQAIEQAERDHREALLSGVLDLQATYASVNRSLQPWAQQAAAQVVTGQDQVWRQLRETTLILLEPAKSKIRASGEHRVIGLAGRDRQTVRAQAAALLEHFESGKGKGFGPLRPKVVREGWYLCTDVSVDGRLCDEPRVLRDLLDWIDVADTLDRLRRAWESYSTPADGPFAAQAAGFQDLLDVLNEVLSLADRVSDVRGILAAYPGIVEPAWHQDHELTALVQAINAANAVSDLVEADAPLQALADTLSDTAARPDAHPVIRSLLAATRELDQSRYAEGNQVVLDLEADREALAERDNLLDRLRAGAPHLAATLQETAAAPDWNTRLSDLAVAWDWARADCWLTRRDDPNAQQRLFDEEVAIRARIGTIIRELAAAKAWRHFFSRMTEHQRQHLMAWTLAMRRIGKGTGKYAAQHRRAARGHMDVCRSAIPAWVMPIYRVAETVHPGDDAFDVVIVDEASQSGPEALFLQYLAKKIIIVGDDKQISPEFIGIKREDVNVLRSRHVENLPHRDVLGVDNSLFDQALVRYGGRIRLREHFRCMPEIIQFSNNLSYQTEPLVPLRQYGADRLDPVKVTHVPDGYRQGGSTRVVNPPEAQAIVDQIARCCGDPAYEGATMGVISLQGTHQAQHISNLLLEQLGPDEMERRNLVCGDAYDFQGDERDVIFLSLVAAPDDAHRIGTLASERDQRRFNVAASRARDQMWLFHTATTNDLSPRCLRRQLLAYCQNPSVEPITFDGVGISDGELVPPFDSLFEQRVFRKISERGYRVVPQVPVAGYRIDLVVEGMRGRLAVECDGDAWHGPDQYDADMARQRQLERCGWTFWRVRGSAFFRDPDGAMESLWSVLDRLGIHPSVEAESSEQPEVDAPAEARRDPSSYVYWMRRPLPDPRHAPPLDVMAGIVEIVAAEGPMSCRHVYRLYAESAGIDIWDVWVQSVFSQAMADVLKSGELVERNEHGSQDPHDRIVRTASSPPVVVRERGSRLLNEIPPSEAASVIRAFMSEPAVCREDDEEALFERVLGWYGLERTAGHEWQTRILRQAQAFLDQREGETVQVTVPFEEEVKRTGSSD